MRSHALTPATLLCALAIGGCRGEPARISERVVVELVAAQGEKLEATSDDPYVITETDYRSELARVRLAREGTVDAAPLSAELKEALLARMIDDRLLAAEALKKGVSASTTAVGRELAAMQRALPDKSFERYLVESYQTREDLERAIRTRLVAAQLLKAEAFAAITVSDAEIQKVWDSTPAADKVRPRRVHAAQIVLHTEEEGREVLSLLKKGRDFSELARARSAGPEASSGGDLGWFEAGTMPTIFDEVCFALKPGELSELVPSEYGYHVFKVLEVADQVALTFEDAKPRIEQELREERIRAAEATYKESLRAKVRVVRNDEVLASVE
ncbi:peptidylprolyl isomerase [Myxococcota bacterium]|nr:peptidylprolyl isomerase [Myxococcota bacterium]